MNKFFFIFFIIVFLFKTETVFSDNLIYDVNNIKVSGKINSDLDKKKLIQSAFQKAFIIFVNKTLLKNDAVNLYKTKISTIEDLIFAYQIVENKKKETNERLLTINIKFDQKKITDFFAQYGVSYANITNISLTLLPVLIKDKNIFMFEDNFFYNNWFKSKKEIENINDMLVNYNLAFENIEDFQYINLNKENLELIDPKKLTSLDGVKNYVLLFIYFAEGKLRAYVKTFIENKDIDTSIELKIYSESETRTYEEAILTLKEEITQIWKSQNMIDASAPSFLDLFLDIKRMNDYSKLRSIFDSLDLIEDYSALEMTSKYIKVRLKYKGKINKLRDKLSEKKINIIATESTWRVTIN